jgi:hypothetical protein
VITASIRRAIDGTYRVTFPYDPDVVTGIKELVPPHSRAYDPDAKCWYVSSAYRDIIHELLEDTFLEVDTDPERTAYDPPTRTTPRTEFHVLHLQPTAPLELVEAAYRCLSRLHHPDRGGSVEIMQQINAAVSIIRSKVS